MSTPTPTRQPTTAPTTAPASPPPFHGHRHLPFTGLAVLGGVLGGSAAVLIGIVLLWLSSVRRRRARGGA